MILKGIKEKSYKNHINSKLKKRVVTHSNRKINRVGVIVNAQEDVDFSWFKALAKGLNISVNSIEVIAFKNELEENEEVYNPTYTLKDIGWRGVVKNAELKAFLEANFDALISYYKADETPLKLLTAKSNAEFKIGILEADERLNDLIVKTDIAAFSTFKNEVIKYLKILNKI